ncbi:MAG TPA: DUF3617 domain-containing protein [Rhodocyclaceae bacterium]|nr:DUF3617 domain-containing protein [Rhodocyclaceae bacterium]
MKKMMIAVALAVAATGSMAETMMKPGLWELRTTKHLMDGQDMTARMAASQAEMQKMMANMPPQQRKQMEAMMGKQAAPEAGVHRMCVSPEMAARDKPVMPADAKCEPAKTSRSGNKVSFEFNCVTEGRTMAGKGESIMSGDAISSKMDMVMTDARGKHTMQSESQMKFLGSDCQGLKPADQIAREMQAARKK